MTTRPKRTPRRRPTTALSTALLWCLPRRCLWAAELRLQTFGPAPLPSPCRAVRFTEHVGKCVCVCVSSDIPHRQRQVRHPFGQEIVHALTLAFTARLHISDWAFDVAAAASFCRHNRISCDPSVRSGPNISCGPSVRSGPNMCVQMTKTFCFVLGAHGCRLWGVNMTCASTIIEQIEM